MALTFIRVLTNPCAAQTINSAATYTSAEQDGGDNTIFEQIWLYLEVDGFAAAPAGNEQMIVTIAPIHTTAGSHFVDQAVSHVFTVVADALYDFAIPLCSLPRFYKVLVENDTGQNTDAGAVDVWIETIEVTH
ncbi:MAG TPA: hypothetical protein VM223_16205 [Planctomycetota bacterium]|nr:hypothetical protein [Planctomycetota bacterium]